MKVLHLFLLLFAVCAHADDQPLLTADLRFFPLNRSKISDLYYQSEPGIFKEVETRSRIRSDVHPYKGMSLFTLYRKNYDSETDEIRYDGFLNVQIPSSTDSILIFLLPPRSGETDNPEDWIILAMDDSERSFPSGHIRVLNATGVNLDGVVGEKVFSLGFEISPPVSFQEVQSGRSNSLEVLFALNLGDEHEMVYANQLSFNPTMRAILVFRPPRRPGSIQIDSFLIEDSLDPPPQEDTDPGA